MLNGLINKYNKMNAPVKMAFWFLICSFLQKGIGFITTPVFTRIMTDGEFGRYNVYSSWNSIITVFASLGISGNCFTRQLVILDNKRKQEELASSLLGLSITLLLTFSVGYIVFHSWINTITGLSSYLFLMMGIDLLLITACQYWTNIKRIKYDYRAIVILTLCYSLLRPILAIFAIKKSTLITQVEARVTAVAVANAIMFTWIIIYIFVKGKKFYEKDNWKYALSFCLPLIPHYLSKTILNQSDRIMISHYWSDAEAGYYSVAYTIAAIMLLFNSAVAQSLDPWIYRSIKNKTLDRIGPVSYKIIIVIALINVLIMAIAPEVLYILAPSNYSQALWVIPPVTASVFFTFMYDLFASFQFFYGKTKWIAIGSCCGAILNLILNAIFIPIFGFVAAGYTTLVCYTLFGILHYYFMIKVCKENLDGYRVYDWKIVFGIGGLLIAACFIINILYMHLVIRYSVLAIFLIFGIIRRKKLSALFGEIRKGG